MKKLLVISLALAGLLTGCGGQELAEVTLIQTLGVDGPGPVELTALGDDGEGESLYTLEGEDVARAQEALKGAGDTRLTVTHVAQLVLGPEARVEETLWQELAHRESGYGATVWRCGEGSAGELLEASADLPQRLTSLEENAGVEAPTVLEALSDLTCRGRTWLPVLAAEGEEVRVTGYEIVEVSGR